MAIDPTTYFGVAEPSTYMKVTVGASSSTSATVSTLDWTQAGQAAQSVSYMRTGYEGTLISGDVAKFRSTLIQSVEYTADGSDIASTLSTVLSHQPGFVFSGSGSSETFFTKTAWGNFISANPGLADTADTIAIQEAVYKPLQYGLGLNPATWTTTEIKESAKTGINVTRYVGDVYQDLDGPESVYLLSSTDAANPYYYGEQSFGSWDNGVFDSLGTYATKDADLSADGGHPALHIGSQWPKVKLGSQEFTKTGVTDGYLTLDFTGNTLQEILSDALVDCGPTLAPDEVFRDRLYGHSISMQLGDEFNFTEFTPIFNLAVQTEVTIGSPTSWVVRWPNDIPEDDESNEVWNNSSGDASKALASFYSYQLGFGRSYSESGNGGVSSREGMGEDFLKWSGSYTSTDTGTTSTAYSQVGIDISFTSALAYTSTTTCALQMSTDTANLGLDWEVSGVKTSLDIAGVMIDLRMPINPLDFVRRAFLKGKVQEEALEIDIHKYPKKGEYYVNKMRVKAAMASIRSELSGVHTNLVAGINEAENELGSLKTDVTLAQQFEAHAARVEAETLKAELKLNENIARTNGNVANMSKAKTAALMGAARMNEFHP